MESVAQAALLARLLQFGEHLALMESHLQVAVGQVPEVVYVLHPVTQELFESLQRQVGLALQEVAPVVEVQVG